MSELTRIGRDLYNIPAIRRRIDVTRKECWDPELRELMVLAGALIDALVRERGRRVSMSELTIPCDGNGSHVEEMG